MPVKPELPVSYENWNWLLLNEQLLVRCLSGVSGVLVQDRCCRRC